MFYHDRHLTIFGLIVVCGIVFIGGGLKDTDLGDEYGTIPAVVSPALRDLVHGEVNLEAGRNLSRLVTALFLHGDPNHIVYNMAFLWMFGYLTSQLLGQWRTLAVFLLSGICGNLLEVCLNADSAVPIIGASGAICGLEGAYLGLALQWHVPWAEVWPLAYRVPPMQVGALAVIGFLVDVYFLRDRTQHIAYGAHAGGFICGLVIAAVIVTVFPTLEDYARGRRRI